MEYCLSSDVTSNMQQGPEELSRARGVVVSHPLSMREALGSIPSVSIRASIYSTIRLHSHLPLTPGKPTLPLAIRLGFILECKLRGGALQVQRFSLEVLPSALQSVPRLQLHAASVHALECRCWSQILHSLSYAKLSQGHVV